MRNRTGPLRRLFEVTTGKELAQKLELSAQAVSLWEYVPQRHLLKVEELTGIPRQVLRPDLYPSLDRMTLAAQQRSRELGVDLSPEVARAIVMAAVGDYAKEAA